jgi:hypothetical protein
MKLNCTVMVLAFGVKPDRAIVKAHLNVIRSSKVLTLRFVSLNE